MFRPSRHDFRRLATIAALSLLCGCATAEIQDTEQMLAAAGFAMRPADTPEKQAQLAAMPPHRLLTQPLQAGGTETTGYVYADPDLCHCVYVGDEKANQAFQRLAFERRLADERLQAAAMEQNAAFDWNMWGPGFWGPPPIIVVRRHR
ncbi:MAG: hypothetical protein JO010_04615 [Alphaproteobacteria bacterium]|nr:hypothetical protein [Alphaproteobacteria bacterium]